MIARVAAFCAIVRDPPCAAHTGMRSPTTARAAGPGAHFCFRAAATPLSVRQPGGKGGRHPSIRSSGRRLGAAGGQTGQQTGQHGVQCSMLDAGAEGAGVRLPAAGPWATGGWWAPAQD